jgi:hypothetical protein
MRIASISKSFTAVIAGQFVEKGKLTWDDTIDKHHSDLPKFLYENIPVSITLRQLASHTRYVILLANDCFRFFSLSDNELKLFLIIVFRFHRVGKLLLRY